MSIETRECGICLDKLLTKGRINSCEHDFHFRCIRKWSRLSNKCPTCRVPFTEIAHEKNSKIVKRVKISETVEYMPDEGSEDSGDFVAECFVCGGGSLEYMVACEGYFGCENVAHAYCLTREEVLQWVCDECSNEESDEDFDDSSYNGPQGEENEEWISVSSSEEEEEEGEEEEGEEGEEQVIVISSDSESDIIEIEHNDSVKIIRHSKQAPLRIQKEKSSKVFFGIGTIELPIKRKESFL